jgi:hypothetical protein
MHSHGIGHHAPIEETLAWLAMAQALQPANGVFFDQINAVPTGIVPATVSGNTFGAIFRKRTGIFKVDADTSGLNNGSLTGGTVQLQTSINNGATWVVQKTVLLDGGVSQNGSTKVSTVVDLSATIGVLGALFRLWVIPTPSAATYTATIDFGAIVVVEIA